MPDITATSSSRKFAPLVVMALLASYAQFGVTTSLGDVAAALGHRVHAASLAAQVGLSGSQLGTGLALVRLASLGALVLSAYADRRGRWSVIHAALLVGLGWSVVAALSPTYWFFVACFALGRPFLSAASALLQVVTVETSSTHQRVTRLAWLAAGGGSGAGLSALVHAGINSPSAFRWLFASSALAMVVVVVLMRTAAPEREERSETTVRLGAVEAGLRSRLVRVGIVVAGLAAIAAPANGFTFVYGENILHLSARALAALVSVSALSGLVGLSLAHLWRPAWGRRYGVALGVGLSVVASSLAYFGGRASFIAGYIVGVGGAGFVTPLMAALGTELFPRAQRATTSGWLVVAGVVGALAGLGIFGVIADTGWTGGDSVLRYAALITFVPTLGCLYALRGLPDFTLVALDHVEVGP